MIQASTLQFLRNLAENNNRDWFQEHRTQYDQARADFEKFISELLSEVSQFQHIENTKAKDYIFRINRDIRFSKDKSPYKKNLSAAIGHSGRNSGRVDYYLHIQPDNESFLGAGMWEIKTELLTKFRQEVDYNAAELKAIINEPEFRRFFPEIWGQTMKTSPKGYPKEHPEIELLRRKQMFFMHKFSDREVTSPTFADDVLGGIRLIKPFVDWLNYVFYDEDVDDD